MRHETGGFALLTVVVALFLLSAVAAEMFGRLEYLRRASENRVAQSQGFWTAQACLTLVRNAYADSSPDRVHRALEVGYTDLGRPGACEAVDSNPAARLNLNTADSSSLGRLFTAPQVAAVLDWRDVDTVPRSSGAERSTYRRDGRWYGGDRPIRDVWELSVIRGFDSATVEASKPLLTVRGDGRIDPNRAPEPILRAVGLLPESVIGRVLTHQASERSIPSVEYLLGLWPRDTTQSGASVERAELEARLLTALSFGAREQVASLRGWGGGHPSAVTEIRAFLVEVDGQLSPRRLETR